MVDPFTAILAGIAWTAVGQKVLEKVVPELPGWLRRQIEGDPARKEALRTAFAAGFERAVRAMHPPNRERANLYAGLLNNFLVDPLVVVEVAKIVDLRNVTMDPTMVIDLGELEKRFAQMYPIAQYPDAYVGLNVLEVLRAFVAGYSESILHQPDKFPWINVGFLDALLTELRIIKDQVTRAATRVEASHEQAVRSYLMWLRDQLRFLPLRGVDVGISDPTSSQQGLELAQVYVDLDTQTEIGADRRPLRAPEALAGNRHLVLLGGPGSGKSTLVHYAALALCSHRLDPTAGWRARLSGWPEDETPIPIIVPLRDFARWLGRKKKAETRQVWDFVVGRLRSELLEQAVGPLEAAVESGEAFMLFDGMDEIPRSEQRTQIRDVVAFFMKRYSSCRFVITCRSLAYQDPNWQLPEVPVFELALFDNLKIQRFIAAWYEELRRLGRVGADDAQALAKQLGETVDRLDFARLARYPLLLTVMAMIHAHRSRLPVARALLYEEAVEMLLWHWERIKIAGLEEARLLELLHQANRTEVDLRKMLWELAYQVHGSTGGIDETVTDIRELQLMRALVALTPNKRDLNWARDVVDQMRERAGVLVERETGLFAFPHRTFQEYLAGAHLSAQANFAKQATELFRNGPIWREVILLAVGRLVHISIDLDKPLALVAELTATDVDDDMAARQAWLAGDVLLEMGTVRAGDSDLGKLLLKRVEQKLEDLVSQGKLSDAERDLVAQTRAELIAA